MDLQEHRRFDSNSRNVIQLRNKIFSPKEISLMAETRISQLQITARDMLVTGLSGEGKLVNRRDKKGVRVTNNVKGVAELCGISLEASKYPSLVPGILHELGEKQFIVLDFISILIIIRREDVVRSCRGNILHDCQMDSEEQMMRIQMLSLPENEYDDDFSSARQEKDRIWQFAAFICSAQADCKLARHLVESLERIGFKIYYPERDLLPGSPINSVNAFFIEERCKQVIVILTESFSKSPECLFQLKFTNALDPGAAAMKIIPIKFDENAPVPRTLNFCNICDMTNGGWPKLVQTLKSSHRAKRKVLEQISYPQNYTVGVHNLGSMKPIIEDEDHHKLDRASSLDYRTPDIASSVEYSTRNQPDGQERNSTGPATLKEPIQTLYRRVPNRSRSAPVETTV